MSHVRGVVVAVALLAVGAAPAGAATCAPIGTDSPPGPCRTVVEAPDAWLPGVQYYRGDSVVHDGVPYSSLRTHVSQLDWSPDLWLRQGRVHPGREKR